MPQATGLGGPRFLFDTITGRLWGIKNPDGTEVALTFAPSPLALYGAAASRPELRFGYLGTFAAAGGTGPYSYALLSSPPQGVTLNATTGVLSGAVSVPLGNTLTFSAQVTDSLGATATAVLVIGGR
jgi:hypothetical protein